MNQKSITAFGGLLIIVGLLVAGIQKPVFAASIGSDSAKFSRCMALAETGDSLAAMDCLLAIDDGTGDHLGRMVNFFLAGRAYNRNDYPGVAVYLDLGIPAELADHGLYLRAMALQSGGQPSLAADAWRRLAADTTSVYLETALRELAAAARTNLPLVGFLAAVDHYDRHSTSAAGRQTLQLSAAEMLAAASRHTEAVERLRSAYLLAPGSSEGRALLNALQTYKKRHGHAPRLPRPQELRREFVALDAARQFSSGLNRIVQEMQTATGAQNAELLSYYKGRFESGLGRHRDALGTFQNFCDRFPHSEFHGEALYHLGRSAYLRDTDTLAVRSLARVAAQRDNLELAGRALDLLGILYMDRNQSASAVDVYEAWDEICPEDCPGRSDCLWRMGWAYWETGRYGEAVESWDRLYDPASSSAYNPAALYWSGRAAFRAGMQAGGRLRQSELLRRYPYSYYSILIPDTAEAVDYIALPLDVPSIDEIYSGGGAHARKFALLVALRMTDLALREWPAVRAELGASPGIVWWKARLQLEAGDRFAAWRTVYADLAHVIIAYGARPAEFFSVVYPLDYDPQIVELSRQHGVDPDFVFALICQESHYSPGIVSAAGAVGLMQLMPETAKREAARLGVGYARSKLTDPGYNLKLGIAHVARLFKDFHGDSVLVLAGYNAGPSAATAWFEEFGGRERDVFIEKIPYRETRLFIKRNIEHRAAYRRLYTQAAASTDGFSAGQASE